MSKLIDYELEARKKLKTGVDRLAPAVMITLGPKGRNIVFERMDGVPRMSCDDVTVTRLALEFAPLAAGMLITTDCVIVKKPQRKVEPALGELT